MSSKINKYKVGDKIEFYFLDVLKWGIVKEINTKDNTVSIISTNNIIYVAHATEKDSKFCFLKNN